MNEGLKMLNKFNWIFGKSSIKDYLINLCKLILVFLIVPLYFFSLTKLIIYLVNKNNSDYICFNMTILNSIICFFIPIIIIIVINSVSITMKLRRKRVFKSNKINRWKIKYYFIVVNLVLIFIYSINNYTLFNKNRIIKHNIISYLNEEYYYSDIEFIEVGAEKYGKKYIKLYYNIFFVGGYKINLANGVVANNYDIDNIIKIDKIIREKNIKKIDMSNFNILIEGCSLDYKEKYKYLFSK